MHSGPGRALANDMPLPPPQRPSLRAQSTGLAGLMQSAEGEEAGNDAEVHGDDDLVAGMPDAETIRWGDRRAKVQDSKNFPISKTFEMLFVLLLIVKSIARLVLKLSSSTQ